MTDRRSHWDTDLIEGVGRRLIPRYRSIGYCTDAERHRIYTLIEFVEDWQDRTQQARAMSMTDNEAAITRVRALAEQASTVIARGCTCYGDDCTGCRRGEPMGWDLDPAQVLAALDGESDG